MKKTLAILALALFIGGISVPVLANNNNAPTMISLQDEDPKKKAEGEKKATKAEKSKEATKGSDCTHEKKGESASEKKSSDCSK